MVRRALQVAQIPLCAHNHRGVLATQAGDVRLCARVREAGCENTVQYHHVEQANGDKLPRPERARDEPLRAPEGEAGGCPGPSGHVAKAKRDAAGLQPVEGTDPLTLC